MHGGAPADLGRLSIEGELRVAVVPDSGTGELTGLSGLMRIEASADRHTYEFDYSLTAQTSVGNSGAAA